MFAIARICAPSRFFVSHDLIAKTLGPPRRKAGRTVAEGASQAGPRDVDEERDFVDHIRRTQLLPVSGGRSNERRGHSGEHQTAEGRPFPFRTVLGSLKMSARRGSA
jgi:hypothetical protein